MNGNINHSPQITDHHENSIIDQAMTTSASNVPSQQNLNQEEMRRRELENERMTNISDDFAMNILNIVEESRTLNSTCAHCAFRFLVERLMRYLQNISNVPAYAFSNAWKECQTSPSSTCCPVKTKTELEALIRKIMREEQDRQENPEIPRKRPRNLSLTATSCEVVMPQQQTERIRYGSSSEHQTSTSVPENRRSSTTTLNPETEQELSGIVPPPDLQQPLHQSLPSTHQSTESSARFQRKEIFQVNSPLLIPRETTRMPATSPAPLTPSLRLSGIPTLPSSYLIMPQQQTEANDSQTSSEHHAFLASLLESCRSSTPASVTRISSNETQPHASVTFPSPLQLLHRPPSSSPQSTELSPRLPRQQSRRIRSPLITPRSKRYRFLSPTSLLSPLPRPTVPIHQSPVLLTPLKEVKREETSADKDRQV